MLPGSIYAAGWGVDRLLGWEALPWPIRWAGLAPVAAGAWLCLHASILLRTQGKGLPISSLPPTRYVTSGPYRTWRHPIYTGYVLLACGIGLLLGSAGLAFVVVPAVGVIWYATWVRLYEEPLLEQRFGASFRAHRARTTLLLPFRVDRLLRRLVLVAFRLRFRIRVEGSEHVPRRGPVIIAADHGSYLDFMFGQYFSARPITVPVTAEVFRAPHRRLFFRMMGAVPKRRFCADPDANRAIADALVAGEVVGIAPEGERSWTGELGELAGAVARHVSAFDVPIVPASFNGSYRLWPRWAGGADRGMTIRIRLGPAFRLGDLIEDHVPGDPAGTSAVERVLREQIAALRDPDEPHVDLARYPSVRPELAMWRCPACGAEECLGMADTSHLACRECGARWTTVGGDLTQEVPEDGAGTRDTVAGWVRRAGGVPDLAGRPEPLLVAEDAEWREDPHGAATLAPLHALGRGRAELRRDRICWRGEGVEREVPLRRLHAVTTERNDTLQLGFGQGVAQLVFETSSPWRWQRTLLALLEENDGG